RTSTGTERRPRRLFTAAAQLGKRDELVALGTDAVDQALERGDAELGAHERRVPEERRPAVAHQGVQPRGGDHVLDAARLAAALRQREVAEVLRPYVHAVVVAQDGVGIELIDDAAGARFAVDEIAHLLHYAPEVAFDHAHGEGGCGVTRRDPADVRDLRRGENPLGLVQPILEVGLRLERQRPVVAAVPELVALAAGGNAAAQVDLDVV